MSVKVTGFKFDQLSARTRGNIADELNSGADSFISLRRQLAPKDTGWMAEQTKQEEIATADKLRAVVVCDSSNNPARGGNNQAYDALVEYGTVNSDAQPSAHPAFESARHQVNNGLKRVMQFGNLRSV